MTAAVTVSSLEVVAGPAAGTRLEFEKPLMIGREGERGGSLGGDPELSRRHARVSALQDGRLLVEDLGSTNGTLVNGVRIAAPTVVRAGDAITLGATTMRVLEAPLEPEPPPEREPPPPEPPRPEPAVDLAAGGVHTLPTSLLGTLVARAPVRREWIVRTALTLLPTVLAINFITRAIAVEYLDVPHDLPVLRPWVLLIVSVMPVVGNSIGFYKNFGRPSDHSPVPYLLIGLTITTVFCTVELAQLPSDASLFDHVLTLMLILVGPSVVFPTMLGLRVRSTLAAEARFRRRG